jgi:hypothetical protein
VPVLLDLRELNEPQVTQNPQVLADVRFVEITVTSTLASARARSRPFILRLPFYAQTESSARFLRLEPLADHAAEEQHDP